MGRFTMAAKHHQSIAEIYESEAVDLERAVHHYEQAADYFRGEESNSSANKCLLKVAQYAAQLENYDKAIQIYEQVKRGSRYVCGDKILSRKYPLILLTQGWLISVRMCFKFVFLSSLGCFCIIRKFSIEVQC